MKHKNRPENARGVFLLAFFYIVFNILSPHFHHHPGDDGHEEAVLHSHLLALLGGVDSDDHQSMDLEDLHSPYSTISGDDHQVFSRDDVVSPVNEVSVVTVCVSVPSPFVGTPEILTEPLVPRLLYPRLTHTAGNTSPPTSVI
ncbi:MAG: hypothetical protein LC102_11060 [Ignavibacteriales bacterium]|nr:MAG: hypothetical protein F9K26_05840 [Ignavibacteriaceae bacterium]MBW7873729.1 hypothetical protein [Ignavibacteria bacterium]MCZ2143954.1 hypothetical protein [Ignavibacteriales bacterium]OQY74533.1 MAG: hypothetical protein B6D45_06765 [Ignavibacteriales bacterium UTCHB3]MBV6444630.1 hypothetical protein [Ignavibacteriaceae bacterium]